MALDKVPVSMMTPMDSASDPAPSNPNVGQRWFRLSTGVTYQYTNDGTSSFWLDVSSGGIGMSDSRNVDIVGDTDPHLETSTTGAGLAIGSIYYNREGDRYFICTNTTTNGNQWSGRYAGYGGTETMYKSGSNFYKVHSFLTTGTFHMDKTTSCDILVVAGGGGGGGNFNTPGGAGGGAGGLLTFAGQSVAAGYHTCLVGNGGYGGYSADTINGFPPTNGGNSQFGALTAAVGGGCGSQHSPGQVPSTGGSGGGGAYNNVAAAAGTDGQGNVGGAGIAGSNQTGGGGGGSGGVGHAASGNNGGAGGAGTANAYRTGSNVTYAAGGGGGSGYSAGSGGAGGSSISAIAGGAHQDNAGGTGSPHTGHGGGGASGRSSASMINGGDGCSGIIVIRYQVA